MVKGEAILLLTIMTLIIFTAIPITVNADSSVTIKIYTLDDKRLAGAVVRIENATTTLTETTSSNGEASFNINRTAVYTLKVFYPPGNLVYENSSFRYNETAYGKVTVNVLSSWTISVWDSEERDPVPGANITITFTNESIKYSKLTGDNGKASFGPLPSGSYEVVIRFKDLEKELTKSADLDHKTVSITLPLYRVNVKVKDRFGSPIEGVEVYLKPELSEEAVSTDVTDADGEAILKLVPNGRYYLEAYLKDILVYQSEGKEIHVSNSDESKTITVNAAKLNITVKDYDGVDVIKGEDLRLRGELVKGGKTVGEAETVDGVLRFGHTPFAEFTLKIYLGDLQVYSSKYTVEKETAKGSVRAKFYDITVRVNSTGLANQTIVESLRGVLKRGNIEREFDIVNCVAELENMPAADDYMVQLYFKDEKVGEFHDIEVKKENQEIELKLTGYVVRVMVKSLDGEPLSSEIAITLPTGEKVTSFKTAEDGSGSSAPLLPMPYHIHVYLEGIPVGEEEISLSSDMNISITASVKNVIFKVYDRDGKDILKNVKLEVSAGKLKRMASSDEEGNILIKNLPIHDYKILAWYFGSMVLEDRVTIEPDTEEIEVKALGVLDARLRFLDSTKNPLDGGEVHLLFGDEELKAEIGKDGSVRVENLPNTTITVKLFYKGVEVDTQPKEFNLKMDEMPVIFSSRVHQATFKIFRGDGKPLREGVAEIYVEGNLTSTHDLKEENEFTERLPETNIIVKVRFRERSVGEKTIYLGEPMKEIPVTTSIYPFEMRIYDSAGKPVKDAIV
ncbi:MAG TPA: carboxypeptidase regulatory-like domain-containing protein, partial [Nitrososphaeria archaeon]|nr:carboxypeptidase regulatory-like domain-containing protein [Nitrososphaeria archaeon]